MKYCVNHEGVNNDANILACNDKYIVDIWLQCYIYFATLRTGLFCCCNNGHYVLSMRFRFPFLLVSCLFPAKQLERAFTERTWTSMALYPVAQRASILLYLLCKRCDVPQSLIHGAKRILEEISNPLQFSAPRKIVEQSIAKADVRTGCFRKSISIDTWLILVHAFVLYCITIFINVMILRLNVHPWPWKQPLAKKLL